MYKLKLKHRCVDCGQVLTDEESIERGRGPVCFEHQLRELPDDWNVWDWEPDIDIDIDIDIDVDIDIDIDVNIDIDNDIDVHIDIDISIDIGSATPINHGIV